MPRVQAHILPRILANILANILPNIHQVNVHTKLHKTFVLDKQVGAGAGWLFLGLFSKNMLHRNLFFENNPRKNHPAPTPLPAFAPVPAPATIPTSTHASALIPMYSHPHLYPHLLYTLLFILNTL